VTSPEGWAEAAAGVAGEKNLPLVVLGGVSEAGGAAEAVVSLLHAAGERFLHVNELHCQPRGVYVVVTHDERYANYSFSPGTVVIDPFDYIPNRPGVSVFRPKLSENPLIDQDFDDLGEF
jgi:hypothetical protein